MSLPKGRSNSGIKNLRPFPKGKCGYPFQKTKVICNNCEKEFISVVKHAKYCSPKCRDKCRPSRLSIEKKLAKSREILKCEFCSDDFYIRNKDNKGRFCSRQCSGLYKIATGEMNYVTKALIHYSNICNRCGIDDDMVLCVHHIDHNRKNNDLINLEIVCANCHHKHHFGRGKTRRKKIDSIKKFLLENPEWRIENAPFKRKGSEK